jgi:hypothetical protein
VEKKHKSRKPKTRKLSKDEPQAKCIRCLRWTPLDEYLANDHWCQECVDKGESNSLASESHFKQWCYQDRAKINNESN